MTLTSCLACGAEDPQLLADLGETPALCGVLWDDRAAARSAARGSMRLTYCPHCGHVWNRAFDPDLVEYDSAYDNSLYYSPTFQTYAERLARRLIETYGVRDREILEVGCGSGYFLQLLADLGDNRGLGYDPAYGGTGGHRAVAFVPDYFPIGQAPRRPFDLLVCRHVLEHLDDPFAFLRGLAASALASGQRPVCYFEVPSAAFNFGPAGLWDCIYPHVSYFGHGSLRVLLERAGFEILRLEEAFDGEFLSADVVPGMTPTATAGSATGAAETPPVAAGDLAAHLDVITRFAARYRGAVAGWADWLSERLRRGERVALWGAGSKGVVFLNSVDGSNELDSVVDLNPRKWGRYVPGTGNQVRSPRQLADQGADEVLVTNPAYVEEISYSLSDLGVQADVVGV